MLIFSIGWFIQAFFWVTLWYLNTRFNVWEKEYRAQSLRSIYKRLSTFLEFAVVGCMIPILLFLFDTSTTWKLELPYPILEFVSIFCYGLMTSCIFWLFEFKSQTALFGAKKLASIYVIPLCAMLLIVFFRIMPRTFGFVETSVLVTLPLTLNCILVYLMISSELKRVKKKKNVKLQLRLRGKRIRRDLFLFYVYFVFIIPAFYGYFNFSAELMMIWGILGTFYVWFFTFIGRRSFMSILIVFMTFFTYAFTEFYPWIAPIFVIPILLIFADILHGVEYIYTPLPTSRSPKFKNNRLEFRNQN